MGLRLDRFSLEDGSGQDGELLKNVLKSISKHSSILRVENDTPKENKRGNFRKSID